MMGPWFGWGFGGFGGWLMIVIMVVFWGLIIWGITSLVRRTSGDGGCDTSHQHSEPALDILKRQYSSGEIGREEFEEKKKTLI